MPKRMLDSSYLNSPSLARCSPRAQDSFPRFILLADDFGCFEVDPRRLVVLGWTSDRSDVTPGLLEGWLEEYVGAGMAVLWTENERRYCHLTGWFGPHGQRRRVEYDSETVAGRKGSKRHTPPPPADLVAAVAAGVRRDHDGKPPGVRREDPECSPSNFVPAREITVPAAVPVVSRGTPAPAVAVPVADAYASVATRAAPLAIHLQAQCPKLASAVAAASKAGVGVNVGRRATTWGEAEALLSQTTEEAALSAWIAAASRRREGPADVPLGYLIPALRDAIAPSKSKPNPRGVQPVAVDYSEPF